MHGGGRRRPIKTGLESTVDIYRPYRVSGMTSWENDRGHPASRVAVPCSPLLLCSAQSKSLLGPNGYV